MKTYQAKAGEVERTWYVLDGTDKTLGRLAAQAAVLLRGKHKPTYTPNVDTGDYVIVVNAEKVRLTGNKLRDKKFTYHTRYPGGLRQVSYRVMMEKHPERAVTAAIKGMLPHTRLGAAMARKLKVYRGPDHPHQSQKPQVWDFRE
ncbi:MAG: 50S ribosomal protein L13 [Syntrophomonadaceae bacterium]|nr:50S ribosomal protein L13 [Syntrophomonadaceae bacterium]MDH7497469.1 50S ribosomal protein L13 [Syntrophomonadaceae bacterium]